jgi:hypothetical protein
MAKDTKNQHEPLPFTGTEHVLVKAAITLAAHIHNAWKERRPVVPPSDPLTFGVADCATGGDGHTLAIVCLNRGDHGVYLENVIVSDPADVDSTARVHTKEYSAMGYDSSSDKPVPVPLPPLLPILVPSGDTAILVVTISRLSKIRMKKKPFGKLSVSYTVVGVASVDLKKEVEFSVRPPAM